MQQGGFIGPGQRLVIEAVGAINDSDSVLTLTPSDGQNPSKEKILKRPTNDDDERTSTDNEGYSNDNDTNDELDIGLSKKRSMACKRCHSLKVKCVPVDASIPFSSCMRCAKKGVVCEFNEKQQVKKRKRNQPMSTQLKLKMKTEEINRLKTQLMEKDKLIKVLRGFTDEEEIKMKGNLPIKDKLDIYENEINQLNILSLHENESNNTSQFIISSEKRIQLCEVGMPSLDLISLGFLDYTQCNNLLNVFLSKVHSKFPLVDLPTDLSIEYLQINEPLLLNLMIYVAMMVDDTNHLPLDSQIKLDCLISKYLSLQILLIGNKNLQLLKSTLLYCIWYSAPELFHHRRYHMFISLCVSMAYDLGISGRPYFFYNKDDGLVKKTIITSLEDNQNYSLKALILVVYALYISISIFLKRVIFLHWSDYLNDCCKLLENSDNKGYRLIALYAQMNYLMERIYQGFHKFSDKLTVTENSSINYKLKIQDYLNQINSFKIKILDKCKEDSFEYNSLMSYVFSIQAYLFEPSIQSLIKSQSFVTNDYKNVFHQTLSQISESCLLSLKHFNKLSLEEMAINPLFHTSRILYTSGMLLRIRYLSVTIPPHYKCGLFTDDCIRMIKDLIEKINLAVLKFPRNFCIKKIKIILGMFLHTCLNQWNLSKKGLISEIGKVANNNSNHQNLSVSGAKNSNTWVNDSNSMIQSSLSPSSVQMNSPVNQGAYKNSSQSNIHEDINAPPDAHPTQSFSPKGFTSSEFSSAAMKNVTRMSSQQESNQRTTIDNPPIPASNPFESITDMDVNILLGSNNHNSVDVDEHIGNNANNNTWSENQWEAQYRAFNDEFWSDLFFGDGNEDMNFSTDFNS